MGWGAPRGRGAKAHPGYVEAATTEEGRALLKRKGGPGSGSGNKYHAVRTFALGFWWDSKAEAAYVVNCLEPSRLAGRIQSWEHHPQFVIIEAIGAKEDGFAQEEAVFTPDYGIRPDPVSGAPYCVADYKGKPTFTTDFKLRAQVFVRKYPDIPLYVVDVDGRWRKA